MQVRSREQFYCAIVLSHYVVTIDLNEEPSQQDPLLNNLARQIASLLTVEEIHWTDVPKISSLSRYFLRTHTTRGDWNAYISTLEGVSSQERRCRGGGRVNWQKKPPAQFPFATAPCTIPWILINCTHFRHPQVIHLRLLCYSSYPNA